MSIVTIFTSIVAIAKAVPVVARYIDMFYNLYIDKQIEEIDKYRINKKEKRAALMKAISKAETDEQRKALSIILNDISNM